MKKDKEVEESSGENNVEIKENPPTLPKMELVEKVEKEEPYVAPIPYKPSIPFPQRFMKAGVDTQFMKYVDLLKKALG